MSFTISGKICVVTGGASGIGFCFVNKLLENNAKRVYILDFNENAGVMAEKKLQDKYGMDYVKFIKCNIVNESEIQETFDQIVAESKQIDIFMNNAGTPFEKLVIPVNLIGASNAIICAVKHMSKKNGGLGGTIINTASNLGLIGCVSSPLYAASKHGVIGLTKSYGNKYFFEESGIRVMAICPSSTQTPLLEVVLAGNIGFKGELERELKSAVQSPDVVANCMMLALNDGEVGSIFVSELGDNYEIIIPDYKDMRKKSSKY